MISVLIPVGEYPFFIRAISQNLQATIRGIDYRVCFLLASPSERMLADVEESQLEFDFDIAVTDFDPSVRGVHLTLLDWAFKNLPLSEWVYVQHADMFWQSLDWLTSFVQEANAGAKAVMPPYYWTNHPYIHKKFALNGRELIRTHDFAGLYHRPTLGDLSFMWCKAGDSPIRDYIPRLSLTQSGRPLREDDLLDGSDVIGLYYACTGVPVSEPGPLVFQHCWDLFGVLWAMRRDGDVIHVNRPFVKTLRGIESYSWISSFCFDYNKWHDRVFPWAVLRQIMPAKQTEFARFVEQYGLCPTSLKNGTAGVREVRFTDKAFLISPDE
jgi:hypothetical protein